MTEYLNPIAEIDNPDSGKIVRPEEAYKLKEVHEFFCPDNDCLDKKRILIPSKSKLNNCFFKHKADCKHDIHPKTLLHKLAVKWFEGKEVFEIPQLTKENKFAPKQELILDSSNTQLEYRRLEKIIPDVKLTSIDNLELAIEVVVTNDMSKDKIKLIEQFDLPTIRIDLTKFYEENTEKCRNDYKFYSHELLNNLFKHPYTKIEFIEKDLDVSRITASRYLNILAKDGLLKKEKLGTGNYYINEKLIEILKNK